MMFYRPSVWDLFRMAWFSLTRGKAKELSWKVDLYASTIDRVVAERDAAMTENTRLHAELAKALLELASVKRSVAAKMAPSLERAS